MSTEPYVEFNPGDLIAAETMNEMQGLIRDDIGSQTQTAVENITTVPHAENSDKLEGQSLDDIRQEIIDQALGQIALQSGYMKLYKKLKVGEESVIVHDLKNCPLVDLYQLDYFLVVASEDGYIYPTWVNFYLYHSGEKSIRYRSEDSSDPPVSIEIESSSRPAYRLPFREMLMRYNVDYSDSSSMGEIETEFWDALFSDPNDPFDDNQYTHSPWFDRCCREERTVKSLKDKGDWDDLWIKVVPRKTINYAMVTEIQPSTDSSVSVLQRPPDVAPPDIKVAHFDWNTIGIKLLAELDVPPLDPEQTLPFETMGEAVADFEQAYPDYAQELKVMVLLRA
ncbi:hypothetical protein MNBD_CHLOROFLEXI01-3941 [hydrothermal vent metagenome]|uniref:Uncharacterized protein n=1 Tax=hydrothermal vent metagenome TaxID=652676 RepID=A0A3B0UPT7_9ZZZZ